MAGRAAALVQEEVLREADRESNLKAQRTVAVRLDSDWPRPLVLNWNQGIVGTTIGTKTRRVLKAGQQTILPIERAQVYFGMFTIPRDLEEVLDERKRLAMLAQFEGEKARVLLMWGDFPRAASHLKDGNEPLGPCRFPDVYVTVTEADGEEWPEMRLRELYDFGEYYDAEPKPKAFINPNAGGKSSAEQMEAMQRELAETKALLTGVLAGQRMPVVAPAAPAAPDGKK